MIHNIIRLNQVKWLYHIYNNTNGRDKYKCNI